MAHLKEGDSAPEINKTASNGEHVRLSALRGNKVILYFYPKDNTPGCTSEACNLRDNYEQLLDKGFYIIGISPDSDDSHKKFTQKYDLPFPLIADPEKEILRVYGVWGEKKMYGKTYQGVHRTTFIIDEEGHIGKIFNKVKTKEHAGQILSAMDMK